MRALTWHGRRDVRVDEVPDPTIQESTDAIVRITSTAICGSDLHLYELFGPFIDPGDILGHEPMGIVEAVGADVEHIAPGDRVVDPVQHLVWPLLHVQPEALLAVRDDAGARARHRRRALRVHEALRPGAGWSGRAAARTPGAVRPDQGAARARRTSSSFFSPTCSPRPGRPSTTPRSPRAGRSPCSVSVPSVR